MNMNKTLLNIKGRFPKLLVSQKFFQFRRVLSTKSFRTLYQPLSKENFLKHCEVTSTRVPFLFYSSVASQEEAIKKYPDSVIAVPTLHFEDIKFEQPVSHNELCDALKSCSSLEKQLSVLTSTLALSTDEVEKRLKFCKVIESLFRPFFGEIKIQIFGSTVNGFGFKGCDVDMSFETFGEKKDQISYLECPDVPLVSEVMCGSVTPQEISLLPRKEQLLFIHTVLLEFYKESTEPIIFINAHVPLVRFYHDRYNLKCDLSCRNNVAFANTKLLYLFQKLDKRVIPLMMTIRYWAKHVEIIGKGLTFNTYTISLLVIHFLQTRNPPIIPSAKHILSVSDSLGVEDMNDTSFLEIQKFMPPSENTQTLAELLKDFFFFYLYFDFTRVICPLIGGSVSREEFFSNLPSRKFKMNTICVQDPMLESHNVADLVDFKTCKKLISEVMSVCKILQDNSNLSPSSFKWGLLTLLDKSDEYLPHNMCSGSILFTIPLFNRSVISKFVNRDKHLMTAETLLHLLQHVLLFECSTVDMSDVEKMLKLHDEVVEKQRKILESVDQFNSELQEKYKKLPKTNLWKHNMNKMPMLDDFKKMNADHTLVLCAECKVLKNTWLGRDLVSVESLSSNSANDLIEKEHYVSVSAAKQNNINAMNAMDGKTKSFRYIYECYVSSKDSESSLLVNFRPFQRTNSNTILGIFLKDYVPKLVKDINGVC